MGKIQQTFSVLQLLLSSTDLCRRCTNKIMESNFSSPPYIVLNQLILDSCISLGLISSAQGSYALCLYIYFYLFDFPRSLTLSTATEAETVSLEHDYPSQNTDLPFKSKLCASSITLFPDVARRFAISRAASSRRSSRKPLFARSDSPISSALLASPSARTMID